MNLLLFVFAWLLIPPLTIWNLIVVYRKNGSVKGYFRVDSKQTFDKY